MGKIKVNKIEAARRQIDMAIRMLFDNEDPIAIHTLAMAGFRILRDLADIKNSSIHKKIQSTIKPGMEGKAWGAIQKLANFLKHAKKDPNAIIDNIEEEINDFILFLASMYYRDLGNQFTPEMLALYGWFSVSHPDFISENAPEKFKIEIEKLRGFYIGKSRQELLPEGKEAIRIARLTLDLNRQV